MREILNRFLSQTNCQRQFLFVSGLCLVMAVDASQCAADPIDDLVAAAKTAHKKEISKLNDAMSAALARAADVAEQAGDAAATKGIRDAKQQFETDGKLPSAAAVRETATKYWRARSQAASKLYRVYQQAIQDAFAADDRERAAELRNQMSAFVAAEKALLAVDGEKPPQPAKPPADANEGQNLKRVRLVRRDVGDSRESEQAVENALKWFVRNQTRDGGWDFRAGGAVAGGSCDGTSKSRVAATALALLPFLGAGHTHKKGDYQREVQAGLNYLIKSMKPHERSGGGHLFDSGRNYDHGMALIALAEAYAMTKDRNLKLPLTKAVAYSVYAQDPKTGGWMYYERKGGDTSVSGWHVAGLKSAALAKVRVPGSTFQLTRRWYDSVASEQGTAYGYRRAGDRPTASAMTASAHLALLHMGRKKDDPGLQRGVAAIAKRGPDFGEMYYSYHANQIMFHIGGERWENWNKQMRDPLIAQQSKDGITAGSWKLTGQDHGFKHGGRLYTTALATLMLEVYYRHLRMD